MPLSPRALAILQWIARLPEGDPDAEILSEGWECWLGTQRLHRNTLNQLIRCTAVSRTYDSANYWIINNTGRAIARRPELADEVRQTIMLRRGSFSIINDKVVPI